MPAPLILHPTSTTSPPCLHERAELAQVRDRGALAQRHGKGGRAVREGIGAARENAPAEGCRESGATAQGRFLSP